MADDVWKVAVIGQGPGGEAIVSTFHFVNNGTVNDHAGTEFAEQADGVLTPLLLDLVTDDWLFYVVTALCVTGHNIGKSGQSNVGAGMTGNLASPSAPMQNAAIGRKSGGGVGRHNRGRNFLSPIPASTTDVDGDFNQPAGYQASWVLLALASLTVGADTYFPCLYDKVHNQAIQVLYASIGPQIGVQRRRRLRLPN